MSEKKMTNCPKCQKPILNGGIFMSAAEFSMRCPWCQATLQINIQPKIVTEVIKVANGNSETKTGRETKQDFEAGARKAELSQLEKLSLPGITDNELTEETVVLAAKNKRFRIVGHLYPEETVKD